MEKFRIERAIHGNQYINKLMLDGEYTYNQIKKIYNAVREKYKTKGFQGSMKCNIRMPWDWRAGEKIDVQGDEEAELYDPSYWYADAFLQERKITGDSKYKFDINVYKGYRVGTATKNDCFFTALFFAFNGELPKKINTDGKLKRLLNTNILSTVCMTESNICKVEEASDAHISIVGEIEIETDYISKTNRHIIIEVKDNHAKFTDNPLRNTYRQYKNWHIKTINKFLVYRADGDDIFTFYDGTKEYTGNYEDLKSAYKTYIVVQFDEKDYKNLKEQGDKLEEDNEELKQLTKNEIDIKQFKINPAKHFALNMLYENSRQYEANELVSHLEYEWISLTSNGGLIFGSPYIGKANSYDFRQNYASIMALTTGGFPYKRGEFIHLDELQEEPQYGIYRCSIEKSGNPDVDKLFTFSQYSFYTHLSLYLAKFLNLKIILKQDGESNFLYYSSDKIMKYKQLFKSTILKLYDARCKCEQHHKELKDGKKNHLIKKMIEILYGAECEKNKINKFCKIEKGKDLILPYDENLVLEDLIQEKEQANSDGKILCRAVFKTKDDIFYRGEFPRAGIFLTSLARFNMGKLLFDDKENIVRCHTDGFITKNTDPTKYEVGDKEDLQLGDLKLEKSNVCVEVVNSMYYQWEDEPLKPYFVERRK